MDFRAAFTNGLRSYEPNLDYLKNRNLSSKPDILNYLKKKRLENPFKKHEILYNSTTQSRNANYMPASQTFDGAGVRSPNKFRELSLS